VPKELRIAAQLGAVGLLLPVLVLVATATRLSAAARDRRLAAVRLVGGTPRQVALIAAGEALVVGVIGSALGLVVFLLLRPLGARLVPVEGGVFAGDLLPPAAQLAGVLVVVPLLSLAVAVVAMRRLVVDPLGVRRRGRRRARAGWWRLAPLATGLAMLTALWVRRQDLVGPDAVLLLGGGACTVVGLAVIAPAVSRLAGSLLVRLPGTATRLAGRRLQADPSATARTLTGTVLVVFVATWLLAFLPILKDSQGSEARSQRQLLPGSTVSISVGSELTGPAMRDVRSVPGVRRVLTVGSVSLAAPGVDLEHPGDRPEDGPRQVAVARCADVAALLGRHLPCADGKVFGTVHHEPGAYGELPVGRVAVLGSDGLRNGQARLPRVAGQLDLGTEPYAVLQADFLVDPSLLPPGATRGLPSRVFITTDGRPSTTERVRSLLWAQGVFGAATLDEQLAQEERVVRGYERAARLGLVLAVLVGAVGLVLTSADSVRSRRRDLASLAAVGVPVRVLRRALVLEVVAPLLGCTGLALGCGAFASAAYLAADTYYRDHLGLPWGSWGGVAAFAVLVVVAVTSLTLPLARGAARPENLRTE
jgi:predicted lysophospholipase L1 biosynthesis ABC-type transport system permease subunit